MVTQTAAYRKIVAALICVGFLLISVGGFVLYDSYTTTWSHAVDTSTNLVTALQRDIGRTIETYDLSLKAVLGALPAPELASLSQETRHRLLFDGAIEARHMGSVFILDADGHIVEDSGFLTPRPGSFADRDFFTVQRDQPDAGLYISKPFKSRLANEWAIAISRRVIGPQGEFEGVVVGSIRFPYFVELFSKLDLGPGGGMSLFNLDGTVLYRSPFSASDVGRDFSHASVFREIRAGHTAPYRDVGYSDGVSRLFAFALIDGMPLVLSVNTAVSTIYADWITKALLTCLISLILLVVGFLLARAARTELRQRLAAERQTARSAKTLAAFFDNSPDALFVIAVNPDGRLTYESYNRACSVLTGLPEGKAVGKGPREVFPPETGTAVEQRYRTCIELGRPYCYEETRELPGGRRQWQAVLCPILDEKGVVTLIVGSARDMTDLNRRMEERHQTSKKETVGRLTAGVAHNFNNQLQTISSSLEVLETDFLADTVGAEYGELARQAAATSAKLTHGLLAFSGQQVLRPRRINVATLLRQSRKAAGPVVFAPEIDGKIVIEPFTDDIQVDPVQAESCLLNLLSNAREAMPNGGSLVMHARNACPSDGMCGSLPPEGMVIIAVHDTGCGMDEATRSRAFEPFFTTKKFGKDSGLGLSMAQGFCQQSNGDIRILSGGALGARIELWLPAVPATGLAGAEVSANLSVIGRPMGRILVVDDDHAAWPSLPGDLVSSGFEVVTVTSGREGMSRLNDREPYDAVIGRSRLPDMTGTAFLTRVAQRIPGTPRLMIVGSKNRAAMLRVRSTTVTFLVEPMSRSDLLPVVREVVGGAISARVA